MNVLGVSAWRFVLMVLAAEAAPVLMLVLAMFVVGTAQGSQPSQATAEAWGSWIGPIFGALFTSYFAYRLARGGNRPNALGVAYGVSVAALDLALTLVMAQGQPFRLLFAFSALARLAAGAFGGWMAGNAVSVATATAPTAQPK